MSHLIVSNSLAMLSHAAPRNPSPNRLDRSLSRHLQLRLMARRTPRTSGDHRVDRRQPCFSARSEHLELQQSSVGDHGRGRSALHSLLSARLALRQTLASLCGGIPADHGGNARRLRPKSGNSQPSLFVDLLSTLLRRADSDHLGCALEGRVKG